MSPGEVPVYSTGERLKVMERRVKIGEVVLRLAMCGLGVLTCALIGTDTQVRTIFSLEKKAKFSDMRALVFLVIANGIASGYSLIQGVRCLVAMSRGSVLFNKALAWAIFSCDQVMAYVLLAAVAAAMQSAVLGEFGQPEMQWMKICNLYRKFCNQVGEGLVSSFLASLSMVTISFVSAFNLFRLYGTNKGRGTSSYTVGM
ncbi:hypothetical protein LUZ63_005637 [Rhynchospora breviuscula]|uniref:CASP-like protein n=1 Tax=Rhynchospora breviuscula TaxID=2022672 RepID=A0A9Q0HT77_9POAL|nr:hypothetical protein LUZ63_005637 [Rhynchospora breviuscula]